ncbi:MAG: hypothetical protein AAF317_18925, partial [Pseudomonadota bacterium]
MSRLQIEAGMWIVLWLLVLGFRSPAWDLAGCIQLLDQTIAVCAEISNQTDGLLPQLCTGLFDGLPFCKLRIDQSLALRAVSEEGRMGLGLIAPDDLAPRPCDPLPETGEVFGQLRGSLGRLLLPTGRLPSVDHLAFRPVPRNHLAALGVEPGLIRTEAFAGLPRQSAELAAEIASMRRQCLFNRWKVIRLAEAGTHLFGFLGCCTRDCKNLAVMGDNHVAAPGALRQEIPAFLQRRSEARPVIARGPALLDELLLIDRVAASPLGGLPFGKGDIGWIRLTVVEQPLRHLPLMGKKEITRDRLELVLEMGEIAGGHGLGIDPGPDGMGMTPPVLLVEDDHAGLVGEVVRRFDLVDGGFEGLNADRRVGRRIQTDGEERLLAAGAFGDGLYLFEGARHVGAEETADLMHLDEVIVFFVQEVISQSLRATALRAFQDHRSATPSACINSRFISAMSAAAVSNEASIFSEVGNVPSDV